MPFKKRALLKNKKWALALLDSAAEVTTFRRNLQEHLEVKVTDDFLQVETVDMRVSTPYRVYNVTDLDGPGVEAAETPFDINEPVTVLQGLQQFSDNNASASAASVGIKDVPITPTGWIPKVGNLVREKVAVKKEFSPSDRTSVPVLGIHGTRTVILPPLPGAKENRFVSVDNVKLHHVTNPAQQTKRCNQ
ncbi:hypothetical protein NDU88_006441 [Pleurodeles waltl]|uniref:Uncharacterized protein n=1 Tax=Pleurodeles waltl TaxID=8319 RepID=A0AAV7UP02_PLEWA|nr:hypothetical protein NDU88_006441 [Pleurodeles waltl]